MANPSTPPSKARKSERDDRNPSGSETQRQPSPSAASSPSASSTASPSWQTGGTTSTRSSESSGESTSSRVAQRIREQANSRLSSQKDRALDGVGGVTQAFRQTTQTLRDQQHDVIARYVEQAAVQVDRFTQSLRDKDVGQLLSDAQRLARRKPGVFVGSAFALGLLAARFLKSSPPDHNYEAGRGGDYGRRETNVWRRAEPMDTTGERVGQTRSAARP